LLRLFIISMEKNKILLVVLLLLINSSLAFAQKQNLNIVYIGDSITAGGQMSDPATEAPPATASDWLRKQKDIGKVNFSNQGVSGFTTVDFLPSTHTVFANVGKAARAFDEKQTTLIFSIMLGTNDSACEGPNGSPVSAGQYHDNLKAIIDRLLKDFPDSKIIIQRPTWYSPNTYNSARYLQEGLTRLQSYFPQVDKLVAEYSLSNPKHVFASGEEAFQYFSEHYLTDSNPEQGREGIFYLHPNKKGSVALGNIWAAAIYQQIVKNQ
jgi:lysophospholipase L1-like esterase